jgi:hypothetical protein
VFPKIKKSAVEIPASWNAQETVIDLSSVAGNQSDVSVRWWWNGINDYVWAIDDVALFDYNPVYENTVWGDQAGQGDFAGGWNGWTVSHTGDTCRWRWTGTGYVDFPDADTKADAIGCSPTVGNGAAVINATFCRDFGLPTPVSRSTLESPPIDLSGTAPGSRLAVRFHQTVTLGDPENAGIPLTTLTFSTDGGASWSSPTDANSTLPYRKGFCGEKTISLPLDFAGSGNVKIRFNFAGQTFFWMIDDVRIVERFDNDLELKTNFFAVPPSYAVPGSQTSPIAFTADVENLGNLPQQDVTLFVSIKEDQTQSEVFSDTLFIGTVQPGALIEDSIFTKTFTPPAKTAEYTGYYRARADSPDEDPANNVIRWKFAVTDTTFSNDNGRIHGYFASTDDVRYEIGNCYFVPKGSHVQASSVSFAFQNPLDLTGANLQVFLYKWKTPNSFADANGDTLANENEYELVGFNAYTVDGTEANQLVTVPLTDGGSCCISLEDSTFYFATVAYNEPLPGKAFFIAAGEDIDYNAMVWLSYQKGFPRYVPMLRLGNESDFSVKGFGLRRVPVVRLNVQQVTPGTEAVAGETGLKIFPNPANTQMWVTFGERNLKGNLVVEIFDIRGKKVWQRHLVQAIVSQLPIDISALSNGWHILRVISEGKSEAGLFFIVKN